MTKEELLTLAKQYFDSDLDRTVIFGTEDKHFFNNEGDAKYYCKDLKKYFLFTREDFNKELVEKRKVENEKLDQEIKNQQEEIELEQQIKKEELLKKRQKLIAPYSEFESRYKLDLETSEGTFKKLLAELKSKEKESKTKK
ncbi:MAG: hypothetical protein OEV44_00335 [Spirochaetota bacterium]|nr:hypothetical protein [Spirochaetota bacterium]